MMTKEFQQSGEEIPKQNVLKRDKVGRKIGKNEQR